MNDNTSQQMPHNVNGLRDPNANSSNNNIYAANQFDPFYQNQSSNGYDSTWAYGSADNALNPAVQQQSINPYSNWQPHAATSHLDPYGRSFSKSPSFGSHLQHQQVSFDYPNGQQYQQPSFDPSLTNHSHPNAQHDVRQQSLQIPNQGVSTVSPHALNAARQQASFNPQQSYIRNPQTQASLAVQPTYSTPSTVDQQQVLSSIPTGALNGRFLVVDTDRLSTATNSARLNVFVNVSLEDFEYSINRAALPNPSKRRSRNELRRLAADDPKLLAKLGKKIPKKAAGSHKLPKDTARIIKSVVTPTGVKQELQSPSDYTSSEEDSSDESDDEEPSPLPAKRPDDDPLQAVKYDATKALWRGRRYIASSEIRDGLKDYWEVVRTIRDRWKADAAAVVEAEAKNRKGEVPLLKSRVKDQLNMIEVAFKAALDHGHKSILELSAENVPFVFLCYQFLLDRHKANDLDGNLAKSILGILAICSTLTEEKMTKTHLVKVLPRFGKKGDDQTQALVRKIESAAKEGSKKANAEDKTNPAAPASPSTDGKITSADGTAGVKRAAPTGAATGQPAKRVASSSSAAPGAEKDSAKPTVAATKKVALKPSGGPGQSVQPIKTKTVASKPSSMFSGTQAAPKKPAAPTTTSTTSTTPSSAPVAKSTRPSVVASALKTVEEKSKKTSIPAAPPAKPAFSFADTMASLGKPKEEKKVTPQPDQNVIAETAEEKKKRLRKESRRHLRVTFRPESTLEEVRYFTHDPDEELGHDASMTRDVSDVGGEGRMFKQHKDNVDIDEEDDGPGEEEVRPYFEPSTINFEDVEKDERERNYAPYGGGEQKVESAEVSIREQYESENLMAIFTAREDIPPTPKEAPESSEADVEPVREFGSPVGIAADRAARLSASSASSTAIQRTEQPLQAQAQSGSTDIAAILAALQPQTQQQPAAPQPASNQSQDQTSAIQNILASFGQSQTPQMPAQPAPPPASQNSMPMDLASIFASLQSQNGNNPAPAANAVPTAQTPDLASLFASLGQAIGAPPPQQNPQSFGMNGFPGLPFDLGNNAMGHQQMQQYPYENEERKRWRETNDDGNRGQEKKKKGFVDKRFTQPCKFWHQGKCQKGDKCTYLHT